MAYPVNQVLPSDSALQWAQAANQQAAADTTRAELDMGLVPLKADLLRAQAENTRAGTEYNRAHAIGQGLLNDKARIEADMLARERQAGIETAKAMADRRAQPPDRLPAR